MFEYEEDLSFDLNEVLSGKAACDAALDHNLVDYGAILRVWLIEMALFFDWHDPGQSDEMPRMFADADCRRLLGIEGLRAQPESRAKRRGKAYYERLLRRLRKRTLEQDDEADLPLLANIRLLRQMLGLSAAEQVLLAFVVMCDAFPGFKAAISPFTPRISTRGYCRFLSQASGLPLENLEAAMRQDSPLIASGILQVDRDIVDLESKVDLLQGFGEVMLAPHNNVEELLERFVQRADAPSLSPDDFPHLQRDIDLLTRYLGEALRRGTRGANVLLHGPPGVGKTQLVQALAQALGADLYEIAFSDNDGDPIRGQRRLRAYNLCQRLLARRDNALLMFDEIEDVFEPDGGSALAFLLESAGGRASTPGKAWINRALERNAVPALWISNQVDHIDPAYLRRFDYSVECPVPPHRVRLNIVRHHFRQFDPPEQWLQVVAASDATTPAQLEKAARVAALASAGDPQRALALADQALASSAALLGQPPLPAPHRQADYDLAFLNLDTNVQRLLAGLQRRPDASLCFYGPPGTGKSELARHLARECDKPLLVRRASDLLSKWVGGTEKNISAMFRQARNEGAVLLLDEADSFLADRRDATHSWEVSQVNELLTQMEAFEGIFICTTNLMEKLDTASLRRFALKVRFDYLSVEQRWELFVRELERLGGGRNGLSLVEGAVRTLEKLTPGDFAVVVRQYQLWDERPSPAEFYKLLRRECSAKGASSHRIGFV